MRTLITGMGGFAGGHLAENLLAEGWEVFGTVLPGEEAGLPETVAASCKALHCDITDGASVRKLIGDVQPEALFHLAAQSSVASSWEDPERTFQVNLMGSLAVLEAVRQKAPGARVLLVSSAEVYGESLASGPATEETPLRPTTPYAASKACADLVSGQLGASYGLDVRRARPFNHTGPRQRPVFATSSFARQIAAIEAGHEEPVLRVGNLEAKRDFSDVRDIARAYRLIATKKTQGGLYNVCSGQVASVGEVLEALLARSNTDIEVQQDPDLFRPADIPVMSGDASRLREETGWKPEISWGRTLDDLLSYWRNAVAHGPDA